MTHSTDAWLQWIMVLLVLCASVYLALVNNQQEIIFNLTTLCFGYYFGRRTEPPTPSK
jgi:hypothetical protein